MDFDSFDGGEDTEYNGVGSCGDMLNISDALCIFLLNGIIKLSIQQGVYLLPLIRYC